MNLNSRRNTGTPAPVCRIGRTGELPHGPLEEQPASSVSSTARALMTPLGKNDLISLRAGDIVQLSGTVYAARDEAHRRMMALLDRGEALPFELTGAVIYYVGPTPAPPGFVIGAAGPTTAYRMDAFAPRLYDRGLAASIGKGKRGPDVREALRRNGGVYLGATGGAGALLARHITGAEILAWPELGPEAVYRLTFRDFPVIVVSDAHGNDVFERGH